MDTTQENRIAGLTRRAALRLHFWTLSRGQPPNPAKRYSRSTYLRLVKDAELRGVPVNLVLGPTGMKDSYRVERAIVRRFDCAEVKQCLSELASIKEPDPAPGQMHDQLDMILERLEASLRRLDECDAPMPELLKSQKRRISRNALHAPSDWQTQMIDASTGALKIALCVLTLTGCRPGEVEHGFGFRLGRGADDARLELRITGNKVDDFRGQPSRTLVFPSSDQRTELDHLVAALQLMSDGSLEGEYPAERTARKISALSRKLWPNLKRRPTARSFRYIVRCKLYKQGFTALEIAAYLGQRSTQSQLAYGRPSFPVQERIREREREREIDYDPVRDLEIEPHEYCGERPEWLPGHARYRERQRERERDIDDDWDLSDA